eukprot:PhF_6_TR8003/c0_g1_i1/m.12347
MKGNPSLLSVESMPSQALILLAGGVGVHTHCRPHVPPCTYITNNSTIIRIQRHLRNTLYSPIFGSFLHCLFLCVLVVGLCFSLMPRTASRSISVAFMIVTWAQIVVTITCVGFRSFITFRLSSLFDFLIASVSLLFWVIGLSPSIIFLRTVRCVELLAKVPIFSDVELASKVLARSLRVLFHVVLFLLLMAAVFALLGFVLFNRFSERYETIGLSFLMVLMQFASGWNDAAHESVTRAGGEYFLYQFAVIFLVVYVLLQLFIAVMAENFAKQRSKQMG